MSGIVPAFSGTGNTLYAQITDALTGQIGNGSAFEVYNLARWAFYTNAMPEQSGSGRYIMSIPGYLPAGRYIAGVYIQLGGSPVAGDTPVDFVIFDWDGSNLIGLGSSLNVGKINGSAQAAINLGQSANAIEPGAAVAGTLSTSQMTTNLTSLIADVFTGRIVLFTSGGNKGRAALITAYLVAGRRLTFVAYGNVPISVPPSVADTFIII